jgi:PAS domain S-box-containing protein
MASVLVLDDKQANRDLLSSVIRSMGHEVLEASNGTECLVLARGSNPDLIIADLLMPVMDGYEFVRQLRADPALAATRVVFCTATYLEEEIRQLSADFGVEHILMKPCEPDRIIEVVGLALLADTTSASTLSREAFDREHMQLVNNKLVAKVDELHALDLRHSRLDERLRITEAQYQTLFELSPQPMAVFDRTTLAIVAVNDALVESYGYSRDDLALATIAELHVPGDRESLVAWLAVKVVRVDQGPQGVESAEREAANTWHHQHKDGAIVEVEAAGSNLTLDGRDCRIVSYHDVTDRNRTRQARAAIEREASQALRTQNDRLREIDAVKDRFVSVVSHELRTPLTAIRGYLEIVLGGEPGPVSDEQRHCLSIADSSCEQLLRVVGDLLLIGATGADRLGLELGEVDVAATLQACVVAAQPAADAKRIDLQFAPTPSVQIVGDGVRLSQALGNIISNAIKFTDSGRVAVSLSGQDGRALIEIADTGAGVPAGELAHLFEPFFRASTATKQAIPGTGLGLSITKEIIEAHGGSISVASEDGSGTSVRIDLPVAACP